MNDDKDTVNYMDSINKASRKRRRKPSFWEQYGILVIGAAVLAVIVVAVVFGGKAVNAVKGKMAAAQVHLSPPRRARVRRKLLFRQRRRAVQRSNPSRRKRMQRLKK